MTIFFGLLLIAAGALRILAPALMWRWHAWGKRTEGLEPTRTREWDTMRVLTGLVFLVGGLLFLLIGRR